MPILTRWILATFSIAVSLALPSVPGAAADSAGIQYTDAPPTACGAAPCKGENLATNPTSNSPRPNPANKSGNDDPPTAEGDPAAPESAERDPQGQSKHPAGQKDAKTGSAEAKASSGDPSQEGDDGSSPLVPILVAVAVVAAIAAGLVLYRRRQQSLGDGQSGD